MTATLSPQSTLFALSEIPLPPKSDSNLDAQAMRCKLSISNWDGHKYDKNVSDQIADLHNAHKDAGRYRKRLLPRSALKSITKAISLARREHIFYTLPWGDDDYRILPSAVYLDHKKAMGTAKQAFFAAIAKLEEQYEQLVIHHNGLGTMFEVEDYPGMRNENGLYRFLFPQELRDRFSFDTKIQPMVASGDDFRASVGDQERERIRRQITDSVQAALRMGTREIWQRLYEPVAHMAKRLAEFNAAAKEDKPKLYEGMITNIVKVLDVLPHLNLDRDGSLENMAEEIRRELIVERKELRESEELSKQTGTRAAEIARRMAAYMGLPPETDTVVS